MNHSVRDKGEELYRYLTVEDAFTSEEGRLGNHEQLEDACSEAASASGHQAAGKSAGPSKP